MAPLELDERCRELAAKIVDGLLADPTKAGDYKARLVETFKDIYNIGAGDSVSSPKDLTNVKSVLLSKTYWGIAIAAFAQIAPHFGLHIGSDQTTQYASEIVSGLGSVLAAYGRYKAFKQLA